LRPLLESTDSGVLGKPAPADTDVTGFTDEFAPSDGYACSFKGHQLALVIDEFVPVKDEFALLPAPAAAAAAAPPPTLPGVPATLALLIGVVDTSVENALLEEVAE
jgi:hypothetical protein